MVLSNAMDSTGIDRTSIEGNQRSTGDASKKSKPLSFSISRILDDTDNKRTCSNVTSRVADDNPRVPKLHAATVHHYAPVTDTDGYSHFESQVQPRACSTPENEYPSPTPSLYPPSQRHLPGTYITGNGTYNSGNYSSGVHSSSIYTSGKYSSPPMFRFPPSFDAERLVHTARMETKREVIKSHDSNVHVDCDDDDVDVENCDRTAALGHAYDVTPSSDNGVHISEHHSDKSLDSLGESYHQSPSPFKAKKKKTRTVFSRTQVYRLEAAFDLKRYLSSAERSGLAASLNLSETQIKIWFQNRRNKWKRQINGEMDEIPIPPAFATGYLQAPYGQSTSYGHVMDAREELLRSSMALPAYYAHPYGREKIHPPYLA